MGNVVGIVIILGGAFLIFVGVRGTQGAVFSGFTNAVSQASQQPTERQRAPGLGGNGVRAYMAHSGDRYA